MKKEKGKKKKAAGASILPDESELLGNRLHPQGCKPPQSKRPPLRGATGGKTMPELPKLFFINLINPKTNRLKD